MATDEDLYRLAVRQQLGLDSGPVPSEGLDIFQPIRTGFGYSMGVGGRLAGALFPEAYQKAQEEARQNLGVTETSPWYEQAEAQPALGDVLTQLVPEQTRESFLGRSVGPVARMVANIAGDPTTYTPFILGKSVAAIARGVPAAEAALEAYRGAQTAQEAAGALSTALDAMRAAGPVKSQAFQAALALQRAEPLAMGSAAALAYGPGVVKAAAQGAMDTLHADTMGDALASGANTALMAGLGVLMGKGLIDAGRARLTLDTALRDQLKVPGEGLTTAETGLAQGVGEALQAPPGPPRLRPTPEMEQAIREAEVAPERPMPPELGYPPGARTVGEYPAPQGAPEGPQIQQGAPEAVPTPAEAPTGLTGPPPSWMRSNAEAALSTLTPSARLQVEEMAADRRTASEIAEALGLGVEQVRLVRNAMGIPPQTITGPMGAGATPNPDFEEWLRRRAGAPDRVAGPPPPASLLIEQLQRSLEARRARTPVPAPVRAEAGAAKPAVPTTASPGGVELRWERAVDHVGKTEVERQALKDALREGDLMARVQTRLQEVQDAIGQRGVTDKEANDALHGVFRQFLKEQPPPVEAAPVVPAPVAERTPEAGAPGAEPQPVAPIRDVGPLPDWEKEGSDEAHLMATRYVASNQQADAIAAEAAFAPDKPEFVAKLGGPDALIRVYRVGEVVPGKYQSYALTKDSLGYFQRHGAPVRSYAVKAGDISFRGASTDQEVVIRSDRLAGQRPMPAVAPIRIPRKPVPRAEGTAVKVHPPEETLIEGAAAPVETARAEAAKLPAWEASKVLRPPGESLDDTLARFAAENHGEMVGQWRVSPNTIKRFSTYARLREQGLGRDEAIKQAARGNANAERNFVGKFETALRDFLAPEGIEAAPTRVPGPGVVDRLTRQKRLLDSAFPVRAHDVPVDEFVASLPKSRIAEALQSWADFAAKRAPFRLGQKLARDLSDNRLRMFAEDVGLETRPKENTLKLMRRIANHLGINEPIRVSDVTGKPVTLLKEMKETLKGGRQAAARAAIERKPELPGGSKIEVGKGFQKQNIVTVRDFNDTASVKRDLDHVLDSVDAHEVVNEAKGKKGRDLEKLLTEDYRDRLVPVPESMGEKYRVMRGKVGTMASREPTPYEEYVRSESRLRDVAGLDWTDPSLTWESSAVGVEGEHPDAGVLMRGMGNATDAKRVLDPIARKLGMTLNAQTPAQLLGNDGYFHQTYLLNGSGPKGEKYVVRIGKSPYLEMPKAHQEALLAPVLDHGEFELNGRRFTYTTSPMAFSPGLDINLSELPQRGELAQKFGGFFNPQTAPSQEYQRLVENQMRRRLPPGVTMSEYFEDAANLNAALERARLEDGDLFSFQQIWRSGQTGYVPARAGEEGVLRSAPDGRTWKLVVLDRGSVSPREATGDWAVIPSVSRVALNRGLPDSKLSGDEQALRARHYREDEGEAIDLGGGFKQANHDRQANGEYQVRVARLTPRRALQAFQEIVADTQRRVNAGLKDGEARLESRFAGTTVSPYLAGLYHDGDIFVNLAEHAHAKPTYQQFTEDVVHTLHHEIAHWKSPEHGEVFEGFHQQVKRAVEGSKAFDEHVRMVKEAIPEDLYNRMREELVPEFKEMRDVVNAESWRGPGEAEPRVPAGTVEGGAAAEPYRPPGGAEGAAADRLLRVQPGGAVLRGAPGEAGQLRPAAAPGGGPAEGYAPGGAARRGPGRGADEAEAQWQRVQDRIGTLEAREGETRAETQRRQAAQIFDMLYEKGAPKLSPAAAHEVGWQQAKQIVDQMTPQELDRAANAARPSPKAGERESALNLMYTTGLSDKLKAQTTEWWNLTKGKGLWDRETPLHVAEVDKDVLRLMGLETPEAYVQAFAKRGNKKGVTPTEVRMLKTIQQEFASRVDEARIRMEEAFNDPNLTEEQLTRLGDVVREAENNYVMAGVVVSDQLTNPARALAMARQQTIRMDPNAQVRVRLLNGLRESLRQTGRFRDPAKLEEATNNLLDTLMNGKEGPDAFRKALRLAMGRKLWPDKILEFYKAGLLGWPSRVANITGNTLFRGVRNTEEMVAAMLDATRSKLTGKEREVFAGESAAAMLGMRRAFVEAMPKWVDANKRAWLLKGPDAERLLAQGSITEDLMTFGGAIEGKLGEFVRFPFYGLGADDLYAKEISKYDTMYRQVYRNLKKGTPGFKALARPGESTLQATERIAGDMRRNWSNWEQGLSHDPAKWELFRPIMEQAKKIADNDTFQTGLEGFGLAVHNVIQRHPLSQFVFPFHRTPYNIALETVKRTPLGFLMLAKKWSKLTMAEKMTELAKPTMGSAIMAGMMAVASTGEMTGGGPVDFESQDALRAIGWQPYSVKVGDLGWVSFQRLEPIASLMGMAADWVEGIKSGEFQDKRLFAEKVAKSIAENLTNKTFLSGLEGLSAAISHPTEYLGQFIKQMQGSIIPNSLGFVPIGHLARALDPVYRQTEPLSPEVFLAKIPFASQSLAPQYGPTGEPRERKGSFVERLMSPFARVRPESGAKAMGTDEIVRLQAVPQSPMRYWPSPQGFRVPLKPAERQAIAKALDTAVLTIGQRLVNDPSYRALPDTEMDPRYVFGQKTKKDVLKSLISKYRIHALQQIKPVLMSRARKMYQERGE